VRIGSLCDELRGFAPVVPLRLNLLDRHIFKSVLFTCLAAVGLFSFVVALPNIIRELLGPLLAGQLTPAAFARLVALIFPFTISYALPMGILTGVLLTLGRLSADSEVTAMRAAGISVLRIARPVLLLGLLGTAAAVYVNLEAMPRARVQFYRELAAAIRANPISVIVPKTFIRDFRGCVVYVGDKQGAVLRDIWFWRLDDQRRVISFERAETGRVDFDETTNMLRLTLTRAQAETRNEDNPEDFSKAPMLGHFALMHPEPIPMDQYLGQNRLRMKEEWLTYAELSNEQSRLAAIKPPPEKKREHAREQMKLALIVQEKFNLSLAVLSFALIGVPLGIKVSRRETSANLGLALLLVLSFYMLTVMVKWLDRHPEYRPDLLIWLPNIVFIGLGIRLFLRIDRK
jgi:lipopolysaccharide export system permease protein